MDYEDHVFTNNNNNRSQNNQYDPPPNPYYRQPPPNYYYQPPPNYYYQPPPNYYHQPPPTQQYQNYGMQNLTPNALNDNQQSIPINPKSNSDFIDFFSNSEKNPPKNETVIPKSNQKESELITIPQSNPNKNPTIVIENDNKKDIVKINNDENPEVNDEIPEEIEGGKDKKTKVIKFHKNVMEDIKKILDENRDKYGRNYILKTKVKTSDGNFVPIQWRLSKSLSGYMFKITLKYGGNNSFTGYKKEHHGWESYIEKLLESKT